MSLEAKNAVEQRVLEYVNAHASPELLAKIQREGKTLQKCWEYVTSYARKHQSEGCYCMADEEAFGLVMHYFEDEREGATYKTEEEKAEESAAKEREEKRLASLSPEQREAEEKAKREREEASRRKAAKLAVKEAERRRKAEEKRQAEERKKAAAAAQLTLF